MKCKFYVVYAEGEAAVCRVSTNKERAEDAAREISKRVSGGLAVLEAYAIEGAPRLVLCAGAVMALRAVYSPDSLSIEEPPLKCERIEKSTYANGRRTKKEAADEIRPGG